MFERFEEPVAKKRPFWLSCWPPVDDEKGALEAVNAGSIVAFITAALSAGWYLTAHFKGPGILVAAFWVLVGIGIRSQSRVAAVIGFLVYGASIADMLPKNHLSVIIGPLLLGPLLLMFVVWLGLLHGVRGTFAYARLSQSGAPTERPDDSAVRPRAKDREPTGGASWDRFKWLVGGCLLVLGGLQVYNLTTLRKLEKQRGQTAIDSSPRPDRAQPSPQKDQGPAPYWTKQIRLTDGRIFVTDGSIVLDIAFAKPSTLPTDALPAEWLQAFLSSAQPEEMGLQGLTPEVKGTLKVYSSSRGLVLNSRYVDYLRGVLGDHLRFRCKGRLDPVQIVFERTTVGVVMPMNLEEPAKDSGPAAGRKV